MRNILILFLALLTAAAQAQNLTSDEAVRIALKNSMGIQLAKNNVDIASVYNSYGIAGGLPVVAGSASDQEQATSIRQAYFDPANNRSADNAFSNNLSAQ